MIISASRRTDIPAFHSQWFMNRIREGYVIVNHHQNSGRLYRVALTPDIVDCIVFRTKNPAPMLEKLRLLGEYKYLFNITMNPYGREMESNVPKLQHRVAVFKELSDKIGSLRMVWRYDPVMLSPKYDFDFHRRAFTYLCRELQHKAYKCMIGFIIHHPFVAKRIDPLSVSKSDSDQMRKIGGMFGKIARGFGIKLETCATELGLDEFGISHGACVDRDQIEQICGYRFGKVRERYLRPHCNCMESVDIGHYSTCGNGCLYCYATTYAPQLNIDSSSPSLDPRFGQSALDKTDIVDLVSESHRSLQAKLFW
ncbi:MAG: DUF1848 domain-containing protein [Alistipes sp.]|nr:DUF1848 domain-containing protein [Alistipes sp.]